MGSTELTLRPINDHRPESLRPQHPHMPFHMALPSPRIGETPPALSPLDAFALQSRKLAKRFEDEAQKGRRMSRLPPLAVQAELAARPMYFRSASGGSHSSELLRAQHQERSPAIARPGLVLRDTASSYDRPISHYPLLSNPAKPAADTPFYDAHETHHQRQRASEPNNYFAIPRSASPESVDPRLHLDSPHAPPVPSLTSSVDSVASTAQPRTLTSGSQRSLRSDRGNLAPSKSPAPSRSPRSFLRQDSGEGEDGASLYAPSPSPLPGLAGASNNISPPREHFSTYPPARRRSPSMTSEEEVVQEQKHKQHEYRVLSSNFSRPRSRNGLSSPSMDSQPLSEKQPPADNLHSQPSEVSTHHLVSAISKPQDLQEEVNATRQTTSGLKPNGIERRTADRSPNGLEPSAAPSYIYSKYTLPQGRTTEDSSNRKRESWLQHPFRWEEHRDASPQLAHSIPDAAIGLTPKSLTSSNRISGARLSRKLTALPPLPPGRSRSADPSTVKPQDPPIHPPNSSPQPEATTSPNLSATSTKPTPLTPDQHLDLGILAQTSGNLSKSTYHLRLAAHGGLPTAMLLYALVLRHGYGNAPPNPVQGAHWLRLALTPSAGLERIDVEATLSRASEREPKINAFEEEAERGKRKAQFARALYELGLGYFNGVGGERDRALAVRCFEVAGAWGDGDALAEAKGCFAKGAGVGRDFEKAAGLHRCAEKGGLGLREREMKMRRREDLVVSTDEAERQPVRARARSVWSRWKEKA